MNAVVKTMACVVIDGGFFLFELAYRGKMGYQAQRCSSVEELSPGSP
jgi:hypothetical protein